jgi:ketosteroid isomerase-like protein
MLDEHGKTLQDHCFNTGTWSPVLCADPLSVVEAYFAALSAYDFGRMRALLADRGFSFHSPIATFDSADLFIQYSAHMGGIIQSLKVRKVFVDGPDVCQFLTYRIQISEKRTVDVAQWSHVEDGRILRIESLYDASIYREMFPVAGG